MRVRRSMAGKTVVGFVGDSAVANRFNTPTATGIVGTAAVGMWFGVAFVLTSKAVAANNRSPCAAFGTGGWRLLTTGSHDFLVFSAGGVSSPSYTLTASDVGRITVAMGTADVVSGRIRLWVNASEVGSGSALASYTPLTAGSGTTMGGVPAGNPADGLTVLGLVGGSFRIPDAMDVAEFFRQARGSGTVPPIPGKTSAGPYNFTDSGSNQVVDNSGGSAPMVINGTLSWSSGNYAYGY